MDEPVGVVMEICWSVKGGQGTTVVAAAMALVAAGDGVPVTMVDLAGDLPAVLGVDGSGPGISDWCVADRAVGVEALDRLAVEVSDGLRVLPRGSARGEAGDPARVVSLVEDLMARSASTGHRTPVVDAGDLFTGRPDAGPPGCLVDPLMEAADRSVLVTRACYLGLRRLSRQDRRPSEVALVVEPGRALDRHDVEAVVGAPVTMRIPVDPAVARAVDAGLLARRTPRSLVRAVGAA